VIRGEVDAGNLLRRKKMKNVMGRHQVVEARKK
jgi:hypothetical protein